MTREERIQARRTRWAEPRTEADPVRAEALERLTKLAKIAVSPEWDALRDILDTCARPRLIAFDQPNWAILTAVEEGQRQLAQQLLAIVEEAPDKVKKLMMTQPNPTEGAA